MTRKEIFLKSAEYYIEHEMSIIPVSKSKIPLIPWKQYQEERATLDQVDKWLDEYPDMQLGVVTGKISSIIVVDIEQGGDVSWLPKTAIVSTGWGWFHYYYSYVPGMNNKVRIKNLTDIRGDWGYVIVPPSVNEKGAYKWIVKTQPVPFPIHLFQEPEIKEYTKIETNYQGYSVGQRNNEMAKYIGHLLAKIHPSEWENIALRMAKEANEKNSPPLSDYELTTTFNSIVNLEKRNKTDRWYQKTDEVETSVMWKESDNKIMLIKDIAAMNEYQVGDKYRTCYDIFDEAFGGGVEDGDLIVISGLSGFGKCHWKWTKIMMYNGSIKNVEDVVIGDQLMGDDSTPRNILSLSTGTEKIYSVKNIKWQELYTVNESHIMSVYWARNDLLSMSGKYWGKWIKDIPLTEIVGASKSFKRFNYGYRVWLDFNEKQLPLDPYFIGLWLGDGSSGWPDVTTADDKIVRYLYQYAQQLNLWINISSKKDNLASTYKITRDKKFKPVDPKNVGWYGDVVSLKSMLRELNLLNNKHIPDIYKFNSRENRLKLLAWLIDTDGNKIGNCYEITQKSKVLIDDIIWLARSLGMSTSLKEVTKTIKSIGFSGQYWRAWINGELSNVPVLLKRKKCHKRLINKNPLLYSIYIEEKWVDKYYGFTIDGNHRYVLWDFSVTHNSLFASTLAVNFAEQWLPVLYFSYEVLMHHLWTKLKDMGIRDDLIIYSVQKHTTGNVGWIEEKIKEAKEQYMIKIVVIDHLGFLVPKSTMADLSKNYSAYVGQVVRDLKTIAKNERIVILLPVHLRKTSDPDINDLKDSSAISQESDAVFILNREKNQNETENQVYTDHTKIMLVKNRKTGVAAQGWFTMTGGKLTRDPWYIPQKKPKVDRYGK